MAQTGGLSTFAAPNLIGSSGQIDPPLWQVGERSSAQQAVLASSIGAQLLGMPYLASVGAGPTPSAAPPLSTSTGADAGQAENAETQRGSNAAQQERNRQAQQRYRERKKAKQAELEWTVKQLQQQAAAMQAMQQRTQILEGMNSELHAALAQKQHEAERLRHALCEAAEQRAAAEGAACCGGGPCGGSGGGCASRSGSAKEQGSLRCTATATATATSGAGADLRGGLQAQTAELRAFLAEHRLDGVGALGEDVSEEVMSRAAHLVCRGRHLCLATEHVEGPGQPPAASQVDWGATLAAMALTPEQREAALRARSEHLEQLRAIYSERQALNMQAMALMLPGAGGCAGPGCCGEDEGAARRGAELGACLDLVKDNLRRETQAVLDFKGQVVTRILTPIQAARYMAAAHPHHCDVLALCNVLAREVERGAAPPAPGAPRHPAG